MDYAIWQIEKIRNALQSYKNNNKKSGKKCSDADVEVALHTNDKVMEKYRLRAKMDGAKLDKPVAKEAIRRFLTENKTPHQENLRDIAIFLIDSGELREDEIEGRSDELKEILTVTSYLANRSESALNILDKLQKNWVVNTNSNDSFIMVNLNISRDEGTPFIYVEEVIKTKNYKTDEKSKKSRRGYGFIINWTNELHIILKGEEPEESVLYTEVVDCKANILACRSKPIFVSGESGFHGFYPSYFSFREKPEKISEEELQYLRELTGNVELWNFGSLGTKVAECAMNNDADAIRVMMSNPSIVLDVDAINWKTHLQMTPLLHAAWHGNEVVADLLINSGMCDFLVTDFFGRYASDLAFEIGRNFDLSEKLFALELKQAQEQGVKLNTIKI